MIAVGDRVRVAAQGGDYVRVGQEWWPGRVGYALRADAKDVVVLWVDGGRSTVPLAQVRPELPLPCGVCGRPVYRGFGCLSRLEMEFVPDIRGPLALVAGRGIIRDTPEAAAQARMRRERNGRLDPLAGMTAHWRVCSAAPKYVAVPSPHGRRPARADAARPGVGRASSDRPAAGRA